MPAVDVSRRGARRRCSSRPTPPSRRVEPGVGAGWRRWATLATGNLLVVRRRAPCGPRTGRRLPGDDPRGRGRVRPGRAVRGRSRVGCGGPAAAGPAAARRLPAGRPGDGRAQPRRDSRAAHADRRRRRGHAAAPRTGPARSPACGWRTRPRCCCRSPTSPTCSPSPTSTSTSSASRAGWRRCWWSCSSWSTSGCGSCSAASSPCRRPSTGTSPARRCPCSPSWWWR